MVSWGIAKVNSGVQLEYHFSTRKKCALDYSEDMVGRGVDKVNGGVQLEYRFIYKKEVCIG